MAKEQAHRSTVDLVPIVSCIPEPVNAPDAGAICIKRDGGVVMVIRVFPIDFDMRSVAEQEAILATWAEMLDSLEEDCPIQICCHNKKLDAEAFIKQFSIRLRDQNLSPLRRQLIEDQMTHFQNIIVSNTMVQKEFYIVVPYKTSAQAVLERAGDNIPLGIFFRRLQENTRSKQVMTPDPETLELARFELDTRCGQIEFYLQRIGCETARLREDQIRGLYYELFHPSLAERQKPMASTRSRGMAGPLNTQNIQRRRREIRDHIAQEGQISQGQRRKALPPKSSQDDYTPPPPDL